MPGGIGWRIPPCSASGAVKGWGVSAAGQGVHSTHGRQGNADVEDYSGKAASKGQSGTRLRK